MTDKISYAARVGDAKSLQGLLGIGNRVSSHRASKSGYDHQNHHRGGNTARAVTRTRRTGLSKKQRYQPDASLGRAPGRTPGRAVYKKDARTARDNRERMTVEVQ